MTNEPPEPIASKLAELIRAERTVRPPDDAIPRMRSRLMQAVGGGGTGGGPRTSGASGAAAGASHSVGGVLIAGIVAAGAMGIAAHHVLARTPASPVHAVVPVVAPLLPAVAPPRAAEPVALPPSLPTIDIEDLPVARSGASPTHAVAAPHPSSTLAEERDVLELARAALAQGDDAAALRWTDEHARRFARPQLVEDREAIAIQALVAMHRYDEARSRAEAFESAWKGSLFLPAVEASLRSIP